MNTVAFTVCFAVWMMYGVLITYLVSQHVYGFDKTQMGWLIGTPVLTGAIFRLPVGVLTDKYGGRIIFVAVMLIAAAGAFVTSMADSFTGFFLAGLFFGLAGASFAVGIAYSSVWFPPERQGLALGIFGAGNAGAAITSLGAPALLNSLTDGGQNIEGWRTLPKIYALSLVVMAVIFWFFTYSKKIEHGEGYTLGQRLAPLKQMRVWRFGLYYFFVFGGFVALAQWLIPYYVNVYAVSVATAGYLATIFTLPSGLIRALGGWLSDKLGARRIMYWVLGGSVLLSFLLVIPRMDVYATGEGVMAGAPGRVESADAEHVQVEPSATAWFKRARPRPSTTRRTESCRLESFGKCQSSRPATRSRRSSSSLAVSRTFTFRPTFGSSRASFSLSGSSWASARPLFTNTSRCTSPRTSESLAASLVFSAVSVVFCVQFSLATCSGAPAFGPRVGFSSFSFRWDA